MKFELIAEEKDRRGGKGSVLKEAKVTVEESESNLLVQHKVDFRKERWRASDQLKNSALI